MRKRVIRLKDGVLVSDIEASDYTTGSLPRVRLDETSRAQQAAASAPTTPDVADGWDDADPEAYDDGDDGDDVNDDGLPPIGRDADAPRPRGGIFRRQKAVHTSER
jgi:cell division transport system ATP-binding protein